MKPNRAYFCDCLDEYRKFDLMKQNVMDAIGAGEMEVPARFQDKYIELLIQSTIGTNDYKYFNEILDSVWDYLTWGYLTYTDSQGEHTIESDEELYDSLINSD